MISDPGASPQVVVEPWSVEPLVGTIDAALADPVEVLQRAHTEILHIVSLAQALASTSATTSTAAAASAVCDFVADELHLHLEDEERSIAPRLGGLHPVVDRALANMKRDHFQLGATLSRLTGLCGVVARDPQRLHEYRFLIEQAADELGRQLARHHALEESIVFPALKRLLRTAELTEIRREMNRRRRALPV